MASNRSKPYQSALLRALGFRVPATLVTTDPLAAREFWRRHGDVIYKSVSGVRSVVAQLTDDHSARLDDVANCPTQFQRRIAGVDHRVHVVGDEVFACAVYCEADDYRYAAARGSAVDMAACSLPDELESRCRGAAHALGLAVAGIDLRQTPAGECCFEVNPSPAFTTTGPMEARSRGPSRGCSTAPPAGRGAPRPTKCRTAAGLGPDPADSPR
jgi:glutathione synthase/RimK-type ligase-like ATP-grasp enzyme